MKEQEEDAATWCKWYVTRSYTQAYVQQIYAGEGNLDGMIQSCLGYMWEAEDSLEGIKAYHAYLQHEYAFVHDGIRNNPSRVSALSEDLVGLNDNVDPAGLVETPLSEFFDYSPWSQPLLLAAYTTKKGAGAAVRDGWEPDRIPLSQWLAELPAEQQNILLTYVHVGIAETMDMLNVSRQQVKTVLQKVRRAGSRAV